MTETQRITVQRLIDAPPAAVFDVLSNPHRHPELDGSGMLRSLDQGDRLQETGQVFRMNMVHERAGEYQTDNTVTGLDPNHLVAWQTGPVGEEPGGWEWVWELTPHGSTGTEVTVTYDWSKVSDPAVLERLSFPVIPPSALEDSLGALAAAVAG